MRHLNDSRFDPAAAADVLDHAVTRLVFERVVERRQRCLRSVAATHRQLEQVIGKTRIVWQDRAVEVCPKHVPADGTLGAVAAIVAAADYYLPERSGAQSEKRAPTVILE